jgi:hypothetical protein
MEDEYLDFLRISFEDNFDFLKLESGHTISPALKEMAWQQIEAYWRKMKDIAETITETEVKLTLPDQITKENRKYTIEGVVDIVRDDEKVVMYDLKTHEAEQVRANQSLYARQLNVYAHIWQQLRGQKLDEVAIIATALPKPIRDLMSIAVDGDYDFLDDWDPLVQLAFDQQSVEKCISEFGDVVDRIEDGAFNPRKVTDLQIQFPGTRAPFGVAVCRYCDARFSCSSYRDYVKIKNPSLNGYSVMKYYLNDYGEEEEQEEWVGALLD